MKPDGSPMSLLWIRHDWGMRSLIGALLRRRVEARFRGSILGLAWVLLLPLAMLAVYTLVFEHFLKVRWPGAVGMTGLETALRIYSGLLVLNFFAENLGGAPHLVLEHQQYVKKIVFPLPLLAYVAMLASFVPLLLGGLVALLFVGFMRVESLPSLWLLPLCLIPLLFWGLAIQWWLGAIGVFVRDLGHLVGPLVSFLMFLSPIFYDRAMIPQPWQQWLLFNPLTLPIENLRGVLFSGEFSSPAGLLANAMLALLLAMSGRAFFKRLQPGFADVI